MKNLEAEMAKDKLDHQTSINKIVFKAIDEIELTHLQKLKFLQFSKIQARIEYLMKVINQKTENTKSVFGLEDKVRQEMYNKSQNKKKIALPRTIFDNFDKDDFNKELTEKMKDKK